MNFEKIKTYFPVFRKAKSKNIEMTHTKKLYLLIDFERKNTEEPSPLVGEGGGDSRRKGQV